MNLLADQVIDRLGPLLYHLRNVSSLIQDIRSVPAANDI